MAQGYNNILIKVQYFFPIMSSDGVPFLAEKYHKLPYICSLQDSCQILAKSEARYQLTLIWGTIEITYFGGPWHIVPCTFPGLLRDFETKSFHQISSPVYVERSYIL